MRHQGGRSAAQHEVIQRLWGNVVVKEAETDIRVAVLPEDAVGSSPGDGTNCLLARACRRQFGTTRVVFFRTVAYIEIPDEEGNMVVERFLIPRSAQRVIHDFDVLNVVRQGAAFVLKAPKASMTAEYQRLYQREHREAKILGEVVVDKQGARAKASRASRERRDVVVGQMAGSGVSGGGTGVMSGVLRNGTGLVQFRPEP